MTNIKAAEVLVRVENGAARRKTPDEFLAQAFRASRALFRIALAFLVLTTASAVAGPIIPGFINEVSAGTGFQSFSNSSNLNANYSWQWWYTDQYFNLTQETATFLASGTNLTDPGTFSMGAGISMSVSNWGFQPGNTLSYPEDFTASSQTYIQLTDPNFVYDNGANGLPATGYLGITVQVNGALNGGVGVLGFQNENDSHLPSTVGLNGGSQTITELVPFDLTDPTILKWGSPIVDIALMVEVDVAPTSLFQSFSVSGDYIDTASIVAAAVYDSNENLIPGVTFDGLPTSLTPEPAYGWLLAGMLCVIAVTRYRRNRSPEVVSMASRVGRRGL